MEFEHKSVMLQQCIQALQLRPSGVYLDGTAGGGGHSYEIAKNLTSGHLYALDQDPAAITAATNRLQGLQATVIQANFGSAQQVLLQHGVQAIDGALLDLGVSSHQLDAAERGFSYHADAPLDMRMSAQGLSAADVVNTYTRLQLADVLRQYGQEKYAWQIAGKIEKAREGAPLKTTGELAELIISAMPPAERRKAKNPARKSFQALRIEVNGELDVLQQGLCGIFDMLKSGGRLAVISFHSLEDRIVKQQFREWATACSCPPQMPVCVCGGIAKGKLVAKGPILPSEEELEQNRRSRSAKLRVIEKL